MICFQKFTKEDLDQLSALTAICFNRKTSREYYQWKYYDNPEGNVVGYTAKTDKGELVAFWGATPDKYYLQGNEAIIYHVCDSMTHPIYRRKGIFEKLTSLTCEELKEQEALLLKVFPGEMAYPGYVNKLGWSNFGRIQQSFKISLQIKIENLFWIKNTSYTYKLCSSNIAPESINQLNEKLPPIFPIIKSRDKKYIEWRLNDPSCSNQILCCYTNDVLIGYCIYCIEPNKLLLIKDIFSTQETAYSSILHEINKIAIKNSLKGIYSWTNNKSYFSKILNKANFLKNPFNKGPMTYPIYFSILAGENKLSADLINNLNNWNVLPIDYDG